MTLRQQKLIVGGIALLGMIFLLIVMVMRDDESQYYAHSLRNAQEADAVAGYPIDLNPRGDEPEFFTAEFEPKIHLFREIERYKMPLARHFSNPLGDFVEAEKSSASPIRLNSPAGGMLGVGDPVYASGTGRVIFSDSEQKILMLGHRLDDGRIITTTYGNLNEVTARIGTTIARGEKIGILAAAKERLGLEFTVTEAVGIDLPAGARLNQLDPLAFLKNKAPTSRWPEAHKIQNETREKGIESLQLDPESAQKLGEILSK